MGRRRGGARGGRDGVRAVERTATAAPAARDTRVDASAGADVGKVPDAGAKGGIACRSGLEESTVGLSRRVIEASGVMVEFREPNHIHVAV